MCSVFGDRVHKAEQMDPRLAQDEHMCKCLVPSRVEPWHKEVLRRMTVVKKRGI